MKKKLFVLILSIFIVLPFAMLFSGCDEQDFIGISAQNSRQKISYGQEFDPIEKFNIRSHYLNGKVETLTAQDLSYTIVKDDETYNLDEYFDCGNYTFEFKYKESSCKAYLTVNKIEYEREDVVEIENFAVNRKVSMPTLNTLSDGDVNFYYRHANKPTEQEQVWLYEEDDINESIAPGDYVIYAKVDEGTNYKAYKTESTAFHVSPEPLDESYSISSNTVNTTYIIQGKLSDYSSVLNEQIKLQKYDEETGTTSIVEGNFVWANSTRQMTVADSGEKHYIKFVSDDESVNNREFEATLNIDKLTIDKPIMTLNPDKTTPLNSVMYDGEEHRVYFGTEYDVIYTEEDTIEAHDSDSNPVFVGSGTFSRTNALSNLQSTLTLVDKENTCWSDNSTTNIEYSWSINPIPFNYGDVYVKVNFNVALIGDGKEVFTSGKIARSKLNNVDYIKFDETIYRTGRAFGLIGLAYKDSQTGEFVDLPEYYSFIIKDERYHKLIEDVMIRDLYIVENESDDLETEDDVIINQLAGYVYIAHNWTPPDPNNPHGEPDEDAEPDYPITIQFTIFVIGDENHYAPQTPQHSADEGQYSFEVIFTAKE